MLTFSSIGKNTPDAKPDEEYRWRNTWNNGQKDSLITLHLRHIASAQRLVILGAPGSGKSTFVRYLALCLAGSGIDSDDAKLDAISTWTHGKLTPIYIELRRFIGWRFGDDTSTRLTAYHLWEYYIQSQIIGEALAAYADELRLDLEEGSAVLILDGLDEIPYPEGKLTARRTQLKALAADLKRAYPDSRLIVASRPYAYEGWRLDEGWKDSEKFVTVEIVPFDDNHRVELAANLYRVNGMAADAAKTKANDLNDQLGGIDPELKDRPLLLTLMALVYLNGGGLPTRRGALYHASILQFLTRYTSSKLGQPSLVTILGLPQDEAENKLLERLAALAFAVHSSSGHQKGTPEIPEGLLYEHLKPLGRRIAADLIPYLSENAGVLVSLGQDHERDVFHFAHRTFQEYLAALHLVSHCASADSFNEVRTLVETQPQTWRVPCALVGDVLADTERRGDLWNLLDDLLDDDLPQVIIQQMTRAGGACGWWRPSPKNRSCMKSPNSGAANRLCAMDWWTGW